jgi:hypothetical protein
VNGERIVTDITANDGSWHSVCVMWHSSNGEWSIYIDGQLGDNGTGLASGTFIPGKEGTLAVSCVDNNFVLSHVVYMLMMQFIGIFH